MQILKKIIINIILIIILLFIIELTIDIKEYIWRVDNNKDFSQQNSKSFAFHFHYFLDGLKERYFTYYDKDKDYYKIYKRLFRNPYGIDKYKNASSIILFGCSYTYGTNISDENDILSSQLSNYLHMPVYNLGIQGGSTREMLYLLEDKRVFNDLKINKNKVKYVIYVYMCDHIRRMFVNQMPCVPSYEYKNNDLYFKKPSFLKNNEFLKRTKTYTELSEFYYFKVTEKNFQRNWNIFYVYIDKISKLIQEQFYNGKQKTKFIILVYNIGENENFDFLNNENTKVVYLSELVDFNPEEVPYVVWEGDDHPSALAWKKIIPKLIEKINN